MDHVAVPILFTFFGALLGFGFGRLKDWLDDRKARKAFLNAIRVELSTLRGHLEGTLKDATENKDCLDKGERKVGHLATAFLTTIYSSQLAKLKDLSDPLVFEVIRFYGNLSNLQTVKSHLTRASFDLATLTETEVEAALGASRSQRVAERSGYRHGAKPPCLTLRTGLMAPRVPRARLVSPDRAERERQSGLAPRYRRSRACWACIWRGRTRGGYAGRRSRCWTARRCPVRMRCYGCSSGCGSADRSSCAASGAIATWEANRKGLLSRKDFRDFSRKMRYSLFYRIPDTTDF